MVKDIQALIDQRPHLRDPLEFYDKWQHFQHKAAEFFPKESSALSPVDSQAYPRENARSIFQLFVSIFDLPPEELEPLCQALESGDIDFMRLPLGEVPVISLPIAHDDFVVLLFLLSRPYFQSLHAAFSLDGRPWEGGRCPLCSARPALTSVAEGPKRFLHCSYCSTVGTYRFIGCPNCGTGDASNLSTLVPEEEHGFRVSVCDACGTYVKVVENSILSEMTADLADLASLPLDIVAQGKQYKRMAPNPIGLTKME